MPVTAPTIRSPEVLQRLGHLIQLAQLPAGNWMAERDLRPCPCGNRVYVVSDRRVFCRECLKLKPGERLLDYILMPAPRGVLTIRKVNYETT